MGKIVKSLIYYSFYREYIKERSNSVCGSLDITLLQKGKDDCILQPERPKGAIDDIIVRLKNMSC